jgi:hypothetical protein
VGPNVIERAIITKRICHDNLLRLIISIEKVVFKGVLKLDIWDGILEAIVDNPRDFA